DRVHERFGVRRYRALFREAARVPTASAARDFAAALRARTFQSRGRAAPRAAADPNRTSAESLFHVYAVDLPETADLREALDAFRADPHVRFAQLDQAVVPDQSIAFDDPFLFSSGAWGQPYRDLWGLERAGVIDSWPITLGEGIVVAVVDTGIDYRHPDLAGQLWINPGEDLDGDGLATAADLNGVDDDGNGFIDDLRGYDFTGYTAGLIAGEASPGDPDPFDERGHGTHVAGTIAAAAGNGVGIAGVAPGATLLPVKVFPPEGSAQTSDVWTGVLYAATQGARVVNGSFSCGAPCPRNPLARAVLATLEDLGVVFVTSAGNADSDVLYYYPENSRSAVSVGSHGLFDQRSSSSNAGWLMDLLAPGGGPAPAGDDPFAERNILSLRGTNDDGDERLVVADAYSRKSGTSMAAPHVSGALALLLSARPDLDPDTARRLLRLSARDLRSTGHDPETGAGALDVPALLAMDVPRVSLELSSPEVAALLDPVATPVVDLRGRATGEDLRRIEIAVAPGVAGTAFETIATVEGSIANEHLADWSLAELPDGPHLIRLRGELVDGRFLDEFTIVGLERTAPVHLSGGLADAHSPAASDGRAYWRERVESAEPDAPERTRIRAAWFPTKRSVAATRAGSELVAEVDGAVDAIDVDGHEVVWLRRDPNDRADSILEGCSFRSAGTASCKTVEYVRSSLPITTMRLAEGRLFWTTRDGSRESISGCALSRRGACRPIDPTGLDAADASDRLLDFDGQTILLLHRASGVPPQLELCRLLPIHDRARKRRDCEPIVVTIAGAPISPEAAALDGDVLAFSLASSATASLLASCQVDLATGDCPGRLVGEIVPGSRVKASGRRLVWLEPGPDSPPALVACEVDEVSGDCAITRLAGASAAQEAPDLADRWVVWEDLRADERSILGIELPALSDLRPIRTLPGRLAGWTFAAEGIAADEASLRLEPVDVDDPTQWRSRLRLLPGGRGRLLLRAPSDFVGHAVWRLVLRTDRGLEASRRVDVEVSPQVATRPKPAPHLLGTRRSRSGSRAATIRP
ncbi:MAG TPA: S8 family serine peptidase, partial [Myxococcota bacterium]|nr:S8 family serine peptidase [Myxococcota bacterium]